MTADTGVTRRVPPATDLGRPGEPPRQRAPGLRPLPPGWPLVLLIGGFPIFWALGLPNLAAPLMAVPMLWYLLTHRPIQMPRGFIFWLLFLAWTVLSLSMLGVDPVGTLPEAATSRLFGFGLREVSYVADTIVFLYIGNLSEADFPQRRLVRLLGLMFLWTVAGGLLGMLAPHFEFTSPFELVLPGSLRNQFYVQQLVHPTAAQLQVFGSGRPRAPRRPSATPTRGATT